MIPLPALDLSILPKIVSDMKGEPFVIGKLFLLYVKKIKPFRWRFDHDSKEIIFFSVNLEKIIYLFPINDR